MATLDIEYEKTFDTSEYDEDEGAESRQYLLTEAQEAAERIIKATFSGNSKELKARLDKLMRQSDVFFTEHLRRAPGGFTY